MTTIIADVREGVVVADRLMSSDGGNVPLNKLYKITRGVYSGGVYGGSGPVSALVAVAMHLNQEKTLDLPLQDDDYFEGLVLYAGGLVTFEKCLTPVYIDVPYYATGSGASWAIGAMDAGASVIEALKIACSRDPHSGLLGNRPQTMRIK